MRAKTFAYKLILVAILMSISTLAGAEEPSSSVEQDVLDGYQAAAVVRVAVAETVITTGIFPENRKAAGLRDGLPNLSYYPIDTIEIVDGIVVVTFSEEAHPILIGKSFFLLPSMQKNGSVRWLCTVVKPRKVVATPVPVDTPLPERCRKE